MRTRNTISRLVLAALLLVLLPLWSDGTSSLLAAETARELCLTQKSRPGVGDAVLRQAASGGATALRRGEEPVPGGHGDAPAAGLLPLIPEVAYHGAYPAAAAGWNLPAPAFVRMQAKLLFPKHWFW